MGEACIQPRPLGEARNICFQTIEPDLKQKEMPHGSILNIQLLSPPLTTQKKRPANNICQAPLFKISCLNTNVLGLFPSRTTNQQLANSNDSILTTKYYFLSTTILPSLFASSHAVKKTFFARFASKSNSILPTSSLTRW